VIGVMVEAGIVKEGTPICVPSKDVSRFNVLLLFLLLLLLLLLRPLGRMATNASLFLRVVRPFARSA